MLTTALREEGPRFLFKGWTPAFIRLGPNTVLMFIFFEVRHLTVFHECDTESPSAIEEGLESDIPSRLCPLDAGGRLSLLVSHPS